MNCQKVKEISWKYQRGQLSQDLKREIAEHVGSCSLAVSSFDSSSRSRLNWIAWLRLSLLLF